MMRWNPRKSSRCQGPGRERNRPRVSAITAVAVVAGMALAGCGGKPAPSADGSTVKVAFAPISPFILPYVAMSKKLDAKNGVTIKPVDYTSTATEIPSVLAGDINIGVAGSADALTAVSKGIPIKIIGSVAAVSAASGNSAVLGLVTKDASVKSLADLDGKTIGVNSLNTYNTLSATAALRAAGVPLSGVKFVQIPYASLPSAVAKGQVAAAVLQEPALTQATDTGIRMVSGLGPDLGKGTPSSVYFVSTKWAASHDKQLKAAVAALVEASRLVTSDQKLLRSEVLKQIPAPGDVGDRMKLPTFSTNVPPQAFNKITDFMVKVGYVGQAPDASSYLITP